LTQLLHELSLFFNALFKEWIPAIANADTGKAGIILTAATVIAILFLPHQKK